MCFEFTLACETKFYVTTVTPPERYTTGAVPGHRTFISTAALLHENNQLKCEFTVRRTRQIKHSTGRSQLIQPWKTKTKQTKKQTCSHVTLRGERELPRIKSKVCKHNHEISELLMIVNEMDRTPQTPV